MSKNQIKQITILTELKEFLTQFESAEQTVRPLKKTKSISKNKWNEIRVPNFRNFKVFVHQTSGQIMIVIPTHLSGMDDVSYHVIIEELDSDDHNGEYKIMSQEQFAKQYQCNYMETTPEVLKTAKITDLADMIISKLPHIKKLKTTTEEDKTESSAFLSQIILEFILKNTGRSI